MLTSAYNKVLGIVPLKVKIPRLNLGFNVSAVPERWTLFTHSLLYSCTSLQVPLYAIFSYCFYASCSSWQMLQYPQNIWDWISHLSIDALALFSAQKFVEHWHWTVRWGKTCKLRTSPSLVQCPIFVSWQGNLSFDSFQGKILTKLGSVLWKICIIHCYYTPNVRFRVHVHCSGGLWKTALSLLLSPPRSQPPLKFHPLCRGSSPHGAVGHSACVKLTYLSPRLPLVTDL